MSDDAQRLQNSIESLRKARSLSQENAFRAISAMLAALRAVLDGERLAGMPNLGSSAAPFYAAVVRARVGAHTRVPLNFDAKTPTLVLTDHGELMMAVQRDALDARAFDGGWELETATAKDLRAEDPEKLANTIAECIEAHCRRTERSSRRFDRLAKFSRRLWEVCEYEED